MRPSRLTSLLLATLVFLHGFTLGTGSVHAVRPAPAAAAAAVDVPQPSVPLAQHDETGCALCNAAVTLSRLVLAGAIIPEAPAEALRGVPPGGDRLPASTTRYPASSPRAPPVLRFV